MGAMTLKVKRLIIADIQEGKFSCARELAAWYNTDIPCVMRIIRDNQRLGNLPLGSVLPLEKLHDV